jgi:murein DD-endopeptidase MepM/ murein hydrolase activator NlpD
VLYGHVLGISVNVGDQVNRGDQVAEVGIGGAATLPHLHFEVRVGSNEFGSTRNPLLWMQPPETRGVVVGRIVDPEGRPWQGVAINAYGVSDETDNHVTWSYLGDPQNLIKPDEMLAENFVIGDLRPGFYELIVLLQGTEYRANVEVVGGSFSTVEIVTEPLKTPTPAPSPTITTDIPPEETAEPGP